MRGLSISTLYKLKAQENSFNPVCFSRKLVGNRHSTPLDTVEFEPLIHSDPYISLLSLSLSSLYPVSFTEDRIDSPALLASPMPWH